ncbi:MAG: hypothetical protein PVI68_21765, partial [Anaerolineae bacterium]
MERRQLLTGGLIVLCLAAMGLLLGTAPAWADIRHKTHTTLEDFNAGTFYHTGLNRLDDGEVQLLVVGLAGEWITDTNYTGLPARDGHTAVYHLDETSGEDHIIVIGGRNSSREGTNAVYYTTILPDHDLANWQQTTALPTATYPNGVAWHTSVVLNGYVYVIGGFDTEAGIVGAPMATVAYAPINADGTLGAWSTTTSLPTAVREPEAVVVDGRIYVVGGGTDDGTDPTANVYYATPDTGGAISSWTPTTPFVHGTYGHIAASYAGRLYVMGGLNPNLPPSYVSPYAHFAEFNGDGTIASWTTATEMENNLYGANAIAFNGVLFTTGGAINSFTSASDYVGAALVDEDDGTIGAWQDTSFIFPARKWHATVRSNDDWIYVIHGNGGGAGPIQSINRGTTTGVGEQYASEGIYTGLFDLEGLYKLEELSWNTTVADPAVTSITVQYRTKRDASEAWTAWKGPYSPSGSGTVTTTQLLGNSARFL